MRRLALLFAVTIAASTSTAFAASLSVGSWHIWAGSQTLTKATCTLSGTSSTTDTYVDEKLPDGDRGRQHDPERRPEERPAHVDIRPLRSLELQHPGDGRRRLGDAEPPHHDGAGLDAGRSTSRRCSRPGTAR